MRIEANTDYFVNPAMKGSRFEPSVPSQVDDSFEDAFSACVALPRFAEDRLLRERERRFKSNSLLSLPIKKLYRIPSI